MATLRINFFISEDSDPKLYRKLILMNKFARAEFIRDCIRDKIDNVGHGHQPIISTATPTKQEQRQPTYSSDIDLSGLINEETVIKFE